MNNSDETLKNTPDNKAVLQAIAELSKSVAEVSDNVKILSIGLNAGKQIRWFGKIRNSEI